MSPKSSQLRNKRGYTLIEITLVISLLLTLIVILMIGVTAYQNGSNRAKCILNLYNIQKVVRYQMALNELNPGTNLPGFQAQIIGPGKLMDNLPVCPGNGNYSVMGDNLPLPGQIYAICTLKVTSNHLPKIYGDW